MEEEVRQGMMGADVQTTPAPIDDKDNPLINLVGDKVSQNLQNLSEQEMQLITQLNVPEFRNFMSKVFGPEFGVIMQTRIPQPQQAQPQPVSQPSESPAPTMGQGMMTQPPSA
jgi:hypothetical protein